MATPQPTHDSDQLTETVKWSRILSALGVILVVAAAFAAFLTVQAGLPILPTMVAGWLLGLGIALLAGAGLKGYPAAQGAAFLAAGLVIISSCGFAMMQPTEFFDGLHNFGGSRNRFAVAAITFAVAPLAGVILLIVGALKLTRRRRMSRVNTTQHTV